MAGKRSGDDAELELGLSAEEASGPVECLGLTFEDDDARREHFLDLLREKLKDPEFRKIEGFPIGEDEDILALSDPPYYTACPNPFIEDFIRHYGKPYDPATDNYRREPFAADVSEGKNDPIYNAHSYHTKVPHKAIMRYILHYTEPGDVVFDGFCGTGMTGVAAQLCGDRAAVESLGYKVQPDGTVLDEGGQLVSRLGARRAVLNDLSPAATFIAYNYNTPLDVPRFEQEAARVLNEVEEECGWMYLTLHEPSAEVLSDAVEALRYEPVIWRGDSEFAPHWGRINYTVWSDVFVCPECSGEVVFWDVAVDQEDGQVRDEFPCPTCNSMLTKRSMDRAWLTALDDALGQVTSYARQVPVLINYSAGEGRFEKKPDAFDLALLDAVGKDGIPDWFPVVPMMLKGIQWGDSWRAGYHAGMTHVHHFFTRRNLRVLSSLVRRTESPGALVAVLDALSVTTRMSRFRVPAWVSRSTGPMKGGTTGTLYVPSLSGEQSWLNALRQKAQMIVRAAVPICGEAVTMTGSLTCMPAGDNSVDYIFTDPPFGGNLMYSELNFVWEAWLRVLTNAGPEAIESPAQGKGLFEYQDLMTRCFGETYRVLKPGRWMTVEFHNSQNRVWNAIQEALQRAGFVVGDVRTLDKRQGSFTQVKSASAVKQDLVISAYKPNGGLEKRFRLEAGTQEGVWDFTQTHLKQLPRFVASGGRVEVIVERQDYLLFDRMVAFHIMRGVSVPLSASGFYQGLRERFPQRDGMFFLPEQVAEYDRRRMEVPDVEQFSLFVSDEKTALQWLRQELSPEQGGSPQTYQQVQPKFLQELHQAPHEKLPELRAMLEQSFLQDGQGRWYVPDPAKQSDLEKLREKALWREFETYIPAGYVRGEVQLAMPGMPAKVDKSKQTKSTGRLKIFRTEAVRAGFKQCWAERDYQTIIAVAHRLPETVIQEDPSLLMYYDNAMTRAGSE